MNQDLDDAVHLAAARLAAAHLAALRHGYGLPQERLARMAAARVLPCSTPVLPTSGGLAFDVARDTFECIDAAAAIEAPFIVHQDISA